MEIHKQSFPSSQHTHATSCFYFLIVQLELLNIFWSVFSLKAVFCLFVCFCLKDYPRLFSTFVQKETRLVATWIHSLKYTRVPWPFLIPFKSLYNWSMQTLVKECPASLPAPDGPASPLFSFLDFTKLQGDPRAFFVGKF